MLFNLGLVVAGLATAGIAWWYIRLLRLPPTTDDATVKKAHDAFVLQAISAAGRHVAVLPLLILLAVTGVVVAATWLYRLLTWIQVE